MKRLHYQNSFTLLLVFLFCITGCDNRPVFEKRSQAELDSLGYSVSNLHSAFAEFDQKNTNVFIDGDEIVIESNGHPNHTSPYWSSGHPLHIEPTATTYEDMAPGTIDEFVGMYTLRLSSKPKRSQSTTSTGLGPIGIAVSGAMIYNDREGPNIPLAEASVSLDYNGAHTGPQSYHYHLEPKAWSNDDDKLIGIIADGFFLYGRRELDGSYPTDLDESGGHIGKTPHSSDNEYHYHIQNTLYLNKFYILFPGDYQGAPSAIR